MGVCVLSGLHTLLKIFSPLKKDGSAEECDREGGRGRPLVMEESGGKGMAPQGNVLGHLKKVRGVGEVEGHRMAPEKRRGDA